MSNMNIDAVKGAQWVSKVRTEIADVNKTLKKVGELTASFPDKEDTIVQIITKTGEKISTTWDRACDTYKDAWEKVEEGIGILGKTGSQVQELFENFASKHTK